MSITSFRTTSLETTQWFVFLLASAVALPIVIGSIFHMSFEEVSGLMQRTFFAVGLTSFLQGWIGHKLPIMEGPAGLWISTFTVMAHSASEAGNSPKAALPVLETAMFLTAILLVIIGVTKLSQKVMALFTPLVTGSFLFLLTIQLSGTFLSGMLGTNGDEGTIQVIGSSIAFLTFILVLGLSTFGRGWMKSYAVLLGIAVGWIVYELILHPEKTSQDKGVFQPPEWLAWGAPSLDLSTLPVAIVTALILLSNVVASVVAVSQSIHGHPTYSYSQINRGSAMLGVTHGISAMYATVANVPLASSSGFIDLTGQKRKQPFMYASLILMVIAFFPPIVQWISYIPEPVANAALLATFVQLMGLGLKNMVSKPLDERRITIITVSFLVGIGLMFIPASAFRNFPAILQNVLSNGLLVGTLLIILLEQLWRNEEDKSLS
ncbi:xanthine permease [Pontibacillus halophilus JSM 076056 = DSM 19796]|uniref:Xanthine permease n=1 Tax=Pontibacillus halophilus JSM 076056 = DSM 19796 TaxID=1385510 RepID=A0A0A5GQY6_9BACI|nr:purine/pyrimidine permease [Pontibacillus halophilus]KGX93653.1 xanthine permease [Pontibacillus halophilus JSM 076056 = DSM 19796]